MGRGMGKDTPDALQELLRAQFPEAELHAEYCSADTWMLDMWFEDRFFVVEWNTRRAYGFDEIKGEGLAADARYTYSALGMNELLTGLTELVHGPSYRTFRHPTGRYDRKWLQ